MGPQFESRLLAAKQRVTEPYRFRLSTSTRGDPGSGLAPAIARQVAVVAKRIGGFAFMSIAWKSLLLATPGGLQPADGIAGRGEGFKPHPTPTS